MDISRQILAEPPANPRPFDADALTRALRIAGAALVVASASTFMLQHWQGGNDLLRYCMLVGQSLLLAAAAYFVGLTLREGRSARTFLALLLATVPVSFAVLGGLVYSQFHLEAQVVLPSYATWVAPTRVSALLAVLGTLVVLVPLSVVSFVALARKEAKTLSLAFIAANLLVIIPVREPLAVAAIVGVGLMAILRLDLVRYWHQPQLATLEGKLSRGLLFAPLAIMIGRVFNLYRVELPFVGALLLLFAAALWLMLPRAKEAWQRDFGAWLCAGNAAWGWCMCCSQLGLASNALHVMLCSMPVAGAILLASRRAVESRGVLVNVALAVAAIGVLWMSVVDFGSVAALTAIALGVSVAVWGAAVQARVRTLGGSLVALYGLAAQVWLATQADNMLRWVGLSALGFLLIVGSAYVERNRARVERLLAGVGAA
jgi:hypothetical protein